MDGHSERDPRPPRPKPPLKRFVAWGLIVGRQLPTAIDLGHVRIRKESPERIADLTRSRQILRHPSFDGPVSFYSGIPADLVVRSDHSIWAWVDARDDEAALAEIAHKLLPSVVGLLSATKAEPVLVELLRISEEDERGYMPAPRSPFSRSGIFGIREPQPLDAEGVKSLKDLDPRVRADDCASSAARELSSAIHLSPQSGSTPANLRGVLLHYFFVLELIARKVGYGPRERDEVLEVQEPVVARGLVQLRTAGTVSQRVKQIHNLSLELKRLETSFFSDQLRKAGETLGVAAEVVEEALALTKFRNSRLGHASTTEVRAEELQRWLSVAERAALTYFRKYVDYLS